MVKLFHRVVGEGASVPQRAHLLFLGFAHHVRAEVAAIRPQFSPPVFALVMVHGAPFQVVIDGGIEGTFFCFEDDQVQLETAGRSLG